MKKTFLLFAVLGTATYLYAQSEGNVGINTTTPTATLHVNSQGSTATTQALKVDNSDGTNLLTINNDGTVSGVAAINLSSGTPTAPKASGIFSGMTSAPNDGFLSPIGNGFITSYSSTNAPAFYSVAQTVPFTTVLEEMTFSLHTISPYYAPRTLMAQLYVNNLPTALIITFYGPFFMANQSYTATSTGGSVILQKGDHFAYRIFGFDTTQINCYLSIRYTEQ